jgi:hypothetical protein
MSFTQIRVSGAKSKADNVRKPADGLIMTATLNPPAGAVARADTQLRLNDYLGALEFYLQLPVETIDRILLVDNSGADLTPLADLAKRVVHDKEVELISFFGNDHDPKLGKVYGEFTLMDFGLAHSQLFTAQDLVWKTTGRLRILNLPALMHSLQREQRGSFDLCCDLHNLPWVGSGQWTNNHYMDLRVFAFRFGAWDALFRDQWRNLDEPFDATFLYRRVRHCQGTLRILPRFPIQPHLSGISGRHLRDYNAPSQRLKDGVRNLQRRLLPWLWL